MLESAPEDIMSWENLIYLADLFEASGERRFPLLGGEPMLHPEFINFVIYLLERNFEVTVFTSGILTGKLLFEATTALSNVRPERLTFICNLNDPQMTHSPLAEVECVRRFLGHFGDRITPGFNVYRADFRLDFLFQYIREFGLRRHIRVGIAHPILGRKNRYLSLSDIDLVFERLFFYAPLFERLRIRPGLDCGFPLCRLSDSQLGWLYRYTGGKSDFGCGPVIDIGPDMTVWPCFPLSSFHKRSVFEFNSIREMHDYYRGLHDMIHVEVGGIFEECDNCLFREEQLCAGGCVAHSLQKFQEETPVRMKEMYL